MSEWADARGEDYAVSSDRAKDKRTSVGQGKLRTTLNLVDVFDKHVSDSVDHELARYIYIYILYSCKYVPIDGAI